MLASRSVLPIAYKAMLGQRHCAGTWGQCHAVPDFKGQEMESLNPEL